MDLHWNRFSLVSFVSNRRIGVKCSPMGDRIQPIGCFDVFEHLKYEWKRKRFSNICTHSLHAYMHVLVCLPTKAYVYILTPVRQSAASLYMFTFYSRSVQFTLVICETYFFLFIFCVHVIWSDFDFVKQRNKQFAAPTF